MTGLRRLPFRIRPLPDEPLDSWLEAMAAAHGATFGQMITSLGLAGPDAVPDDQGYSVGRMNRWQFYLEEDQLERLTRATGLPAAALQATTRSSFAATVTKYTLKGRLSIQCPTAGTQGRFCPDCLRDSGGRWRLSWTYAFVAVCPRHRRVLSDICPTCGTPPRIRPQPMYLVPTPGHCHNRPPKTYDPRQRCGTDLSQETMRLEASAAMLTAQRAQFATISQGVGRFGMYQENPQPAPMVMEDIRTIARIAVRALIRGEDIDTHDIPTTTLGEALSETDALRRERPQTSALAAVGATLAVQAIEDTDRLLKLLHGRIPPSAVFDRHSIQLKLTVAKSRGSNTRHLTRIQSLIPPPPHGAEQRARKLPAQLWPDWTARLNLPGTGIELVASALSTAVLIAGTRLSHADALAHLGSSLNPMRVRDVTRLLRSKDPGDNLLLPIARLATHLDAVETPIDYARRRTLDCSALLPADRWVLISRRANIHSGKGPRIRQIRLLLYSWLTGNHPDQAPQAFRPRCTADALAARTLTESLPPRLGAELLEVANQFLQERGIAEPVRWSPPLTVAEWNPIIDDVTRSLVWPPKQPARERMRTTFTFDELVEEYRNGRSLKELADTANVGRSVISRVLHEAGVEVRPAHAPQRAAIVDRRLQAGYEFGSSLADLASEFGCGETTVANRLRSLGVPLRPRGTRPKVLAGG